MKKVFPTEGTVDLLQSERMQQGTSLTHHRIVEIRRTIRADNSVRQENPSWSVYNCDYQGGWLPSYQNYQPRKGH